MNLYDNKVLRSIIACVGLDKAIAYSSSGRVVQAFSGIASIFFITKFLTGVEQGFYYTFSSLLAIQVFFELGFTTIITQYVAHEASHLIISDKGVIYGDNIYLSRLASLFKFCIKWYSVIALLFFCVILFLGYHFFKKYDYTDGNVHWRIPWLLVCIGSSTKLFLSPFSSFLMGVGKVKEMNKIMFWQHVLLPLSTWIGLLCNFKLYVLGISSLLSTLIWLLYVYYSRQILYFTNLRKELIVEKVSYMKEIFPYQWRIGLSWVSGYFISQLFNPVLFASEGAVVAGQMGMTLQILNAIKAFSASWMNTKIPLYSKLIALKDYSKLDVVFQKTLKQMLFVCIVLMSLAFLIIQIIRYTHFHVGSTVLSDRFIDNVPMLLMMISSLSIVTVASWAKYIRCHKKEPFLAYSIVGGILNGLSVWFMGHLYGLMGMVFGYFFINITIAPWGYWIYKSKRLEWHKKY